MSKLKTLSLLFLICFLFAIYSVYENYDAWFEATTKQKQQARGKTETIQAIESEVNRVAEAAGGNIEFYDPVWQGYERAQKRFQEQVAMLVKQNRPHLESVVRTQLQQEFLRLNLNARKLHFLLEREPERVVRDHGLNAFIRNDWSAADDGLIETAYPDVAKIKKRIQLLKNRIRSHPDWEELRGYVLGDLRDDPKYQQIKQQLDDQLAKLGEQLGGDRRLQIVDKITPAVPAVQLLPGVPVEKTGLAVQDRLGRVYCVIVDDGWLKVRFVPPHKKQALDLATIDRPESDEVLWITRAGTERLELIAIQTAPAGNKLIMMYNPEVPFRDARAGWVSDSPMYTLDVNDPDSGLQQARFSPRVIFEVLKKCP